MLHHTFSLYIVLSLPASSSIGWSSCWSKSHMLPLLSPSSSLSTLEAIFELNSAMQSYYIPLPQFLYTPFKKNTQEILTTKPSAFKFWIHLKSMPTPTTYPTYPIESEKKSKIEDFTEWPMPYMERKREEKKDQPIFKIKIKIIYPYTDPTLNNWKLEHNWNKKVKVFPSLHI